MAATLKNIASGERITVQNAKASGDHLLYQARLGVPSAKWQAKNNVYADGMDVDTGCCILRPINGWEVEGKTRATRKTKASVATPATTTQTEPTTPIVEQTTTEPEPAQVQVSEQAKKVVVPTMTQAESALSTLFAGVADQITQQVMDKAQPIFDEIAKERGKVVRHEFKTVNGVTKVEGVQHEKFDMVCQLVYNNLPCYLWGPAGTGKTEMVRSVAKALGLEYYQAAKVTEVFTLTGFVDANGQYVESDFYRAFTKGGLFLFDEMDASDEESLVAFNAAISQRCFSFPGVGMVEAHKDFRVVGAGNTGGTGATEEYTGRRSLDASTLNRFFYVEIGNDEGLERVCANGDEKIVEFIHDLRQSAKAAGVTIVLSLRNITQMSTLRSIFKDDEILRGCVIKEKDSDCVRMLLERMEHTDNPWYKAMRKLRTA